MQSMLKDLNVSLGGKIGRKHRMRSSGHAHHVHEHPRGPHRVHKLEGYRKNDDEYS